MTHQKPTNMVHSGELVRSTSELLFGLADQLVEADRNWNVIIGEDTSGRLPTRFIRKILQRSGLEAPTHFVVGSRVYRSAQSSEVYADYFERLSTQIGEPLRPLIVTEAVGSGKTVEFLRESITPYCDQAGPEVASVAVSPENDSPVEYFGGKGKEALARVGYAFENFNDASWARKALIRAGGWIPLKPKQALKRALPQSVMSPSGRNETAGLCVDITASVPCARRLELADISGKILASAAIDQLVNDYCISRL